MFLGNIFLEENLGNVQILGVNPTQANLGEILGQNALDHTTNTPNPVENFTNLHNYFKHLLDKDSTPVKYLRCYYCNENFLSFKALYNHAHSKHQDSASQPLKCFICQQLHVFKEEYHNHLSSEHQIRYPEAICYVCLMTIMDSTALQNHLSSHLAEFSCEACSTKFTCLNQLNLHKEFHNCSNKLICGVCGTSFQNKLLQGLHLLRHRQIECPLASNNHCISITSEVELAHHLKEYHQPSDKSLLLDVIESYDKEEIALSELLQSNPEIEQINSVDQTVEISSWLSKLKLKQDIECPSCSTILTSIFQVWIHFLKNHKNTKTCPVCGKHFEEDYHILLHLGSKNCRKNKDSVASLTCPHCKENFEQELELLEHQLSHVKPYQCSKCSASFQKQSQLKVHLQGHGLPPKILKPVFACPVCSSPWPSLTNLRRHIRTHADGKPFRCDYCHATFKRQQALNAHRSSAHSGLSHSCPQCFNQCRSKRALFLHVCRVHVGLRRFVCGLCAKPWPQNQDLRRHLSKVHNVEYPPLSKTATSSLKSIHIIPPMENLAPDDPVRLKIAAEIAQEQEKLRSLFSDLTAEESGLGDTPPESTPKEEADVASTQPRGKIYLSCVFCDFRCEDVNVWLNHTNGHQQSLNSQPVSDVLTVNSQPSLDFPLVPVVPIQPVIVSPVIPINYGTLVTVLPNQNHLTINRTYTPIVPTLTEQAVFLPQTLSCPLLPTDADVLNSRDTNSGELIDINGMFVRIEQCDENLELIRNSVGPSISIESAPYEKSDSVTGNAAAAVENVGAAVENVAAAAENAAAGAGSGANGFTSSDESNLSEKATEGSEDCVQSVSEGTNEQVASGNLIQSVENLNIQDSPDISGIWSCKECGKSVSSAKNLKRHMRLHTGDKPFTCEVCGKSFIERHNLKVHQLTHTQERPYSCSLCGKTMRYVKEIIEHKKKHQGIKDFSCSICGRSFTRHRDLVRHQSLHSADKKYQCSVCSKIFQRLDYLKLIHMPQVHGEFSCTFCKKRFESEEKLEFHQRNHEHSASNKVRFPCPICNKTFARNSGLKSHLDLHANLKAHVRCYACPRKFSSMDNMLVHLENFHKKWRDDLEDKKRTTVENYRYPNLTTKNPTG